MGPASLGTHGQLMNTLSLLVTTTKPYCLSPTPRYQHTTGTEPGGTQVDNCLRLSPEDTPRYSPV
jgi:hypothetical protein